ncbi:MAG: LytTR family DNA-binding domain-containing protein [Paludibacteraceae bacterium]|nr:LytTR family DNA-binding domain-containing protein [Paludibacteraceae bacterium]
MDQVLIIEDEIKTGKELKNLIESLRDDLTVAAISPSIKSAVSWLKQHEAPALIFSDIQLADGLSFEIFRQVQVESPIIFCTAYDEYAIQAFDANGIDYLLKPIDEEKLVRGLNKYNKYYQQDEKETSNYKNQLNNLLSEMNKSYKSSLLIYFQEKIIPIKACDIDFIHSENGIVTIYMNNKQHYYTNYTLETLETILNPVFFYKANRQFIINRQAILNIEHYFTRRLVVKLTQPAPESIIISKVKASDFLKWVEEN